MSWLWWIMLQWIWECRYHFWDSDFVSFWYIHRSGTSGSYDRSIFNFLRNLHTVFHSGYTNLHSNRAQGFPFLHILANLSFAVFLIKAIRIHVKWYSLWLWLAFPSWWMMLSISSCTCQLFVYLLWKNLYSALLPKKNQIVGFFLVAELHEFFIYFGC